MTSRMHPGAHKLYLTRAQRNELGVHAGCLVNLARPNDSAVRVEVLMPPSADVRRMNDRGIAQLVLLNPADVGAIEGSVAHLSEPFVSAIAEMLRDAQEVVDAAQASARRHLDAYHAGLDHVIENSVVVPEPAEPTEPASHDDDPDADDDFNWRTTS